MIDEIKLKALIKVAVLETLIDYKKHFGGTKEEYQYVDDQTARCILAGSDKPIDTKTFNKLRKSGKIYTYRATEGRTLYSRDELNVYIGSSL